MISQRQVAGGVNASLFYGFDQQSNTRIVTDSNGNIVTKYSYDAGGGEVQEHWGGETSPDPSLQLHYGGQTSVPVTITHYGGQVWPDTPRGIYNPFQFGGEVGYYQDTEDRSYVRARHLDLNRQRWISEDPIGFFGGDPNLYRYVGNNPINRRDASGLRDPRPEDEIGGTNPAYQNLTEQQKREYNRIRAAEAMRQYKYNKALEKATIVWDKAGDPDEFLTKVPGGIPQWIDDNLIFGAVGSFGTNYGLYDAGQVSGWKVIGSGTVAGVGVVLLAAEIYTLGKTGVVGVAATPAVLRNARNLGVRGVVRSGGKVVVTKGKTIVNTARGATRKVGTAARGGVNKVKALTKSTKQKAAVKIRGVKSPEKKILTPNLGVRGRYDPKGDVIRLYNGARNPTNGSAYTRREVAQSLVHERSHRKFFVGEGAIKKEFRNNLQEWYRGHTVSGRFLDEYLAEHAATRNIGHSANFAFEQVPWSGIGFDIAGLGAFTGSVYTIRTLGAGPQPKPKQP